MSETGSLARRGLTLTATCILPGPVRCRGCPSTGTSAISALQARLEPTQLHVTSWQHPLTFTTVLARLPAPRARSSGRVKIWLLLSKLGELQHARYNAHTHTSTTNAKCVFVACKSTIERSCCTWCAQSFTSMVPQRIHDPLCVLCCIHFPASQVLSLTSYLQTSCMPPSCAVPWTEQFKIDAP